MRFAGQRLQQADAKQLVDEINASGLPGKLAETAQQNWPSAREISWTQDQGEAPPWLKGPSFGVNVNQPGLVVPATSAPDFFQPVVPEAGWGSSARERWQFQQMTREDDPFPLL